MPKAKEGGKEGLRVRSTPQFHLKDKALRNFQAFHLEKQFGFVPEIVIIEKVPKQNNRLVFRAVLTKEEIEKEDKRIKQGFEIGPPRK